MKRSGSWGKQLRLGNADKPKLDVQLSTDFEDDDIPIDPNRPQFADWDVPPVSADSLTDPTICPNARFRGSDHMLLLAIR